MSLGVFISSIIICLSTLSCPLPIPLQVDSLPSAELLQFSTTAPRSASNGLEAAVAIPSSATRRTSRRRRLG